MYVGVQERAVPGIHQARHLQHPGCQQHDRRRAHSPNPNPRAEADLVHEPGLQRLRLQSHRLAGGT